jgi:putative intracellular protease/amidase
MKITHPQACPMLGALEHAGYITPDERGYIDLKQLGSAFDAALGMSLPMRASFYAMAPISKNFGKTLSNFIHGRVDVGHLRGDFFDHKWDSGLLAGGVFQPDVFARLAAHSADGKTVTLDQWSAFMLSSLDVARHTGVNDPGGPIGTAIAGGFVAFETALIGSAIGRYDAEGTLRMRLDDILHFYRDKKLPEDWQPRQESPTNLRTLLGGFAKAAFSLITGNRIAGVAKEGERLALGQDGPLTDTALTGIMVALCPAMSGAGKVKNGAPTDAGQTTELHDRIGREAGSPEVASIDAKTALDAGKALNRAFDMRDVNTVFAQLDNRSAADLDLICSVYREKYGRDLEYDLRGFALDAKGPIDWRGFSPTLRGLQGADLTAALGLLHGPRIERCAARIAELTANAPASNEAGREEIYGMLSLMGGEQRAMLDAAIREKTGRSLAEVLAPIATAHAANLDPIATPPEKTVAIFVSSGNWSDVLAGKTDQHVGGYHWREIEAYAKEAIDRGYTPVIFTADGLPPSPDALSLLQGKLGPKLGFGMRPGTGPDSEQGRAIMEGFRHPRTASSFDPSQFAALHVAGGHGSNRDLVGNAAVERAATSLYEAGGMVTAVCHATPALGKLLAGGKATGFSPAIDGVMLKLGYVLREFDPPYDAHEGLRKLGADLSFFDRAESLFNIHHTEVIERRGRAPLWTGTGPEATDDVARKAFDWLRSKRS